MFKLTTGVCELAVDGVQATQAVVEHRVVPSTRRKGRLEGLHRAISIVLLELHDSQGGVSAGSELRHSRCPIFGRDPQRSFSPIEQLKGMLGSLGRAVQTVRAIRQEIGDLDQQRNVVRGNGQTALGGSDCLFPLTSRPPFPCYNSQTGKRNEDCGKSRSKAAPFSSTGPSSTSR